MPTIARTRIFGTKMHIDIRVQFGKKLRRLRRRRGWTQAEMADYFGLDRSYVGEIEQGKRNPCLLNLKVLADGLGITLARLFSGLK